MYAEYIWPKELTSWRQKMTETRALGTSDGDCQTADENLAHEAFDDKDSTDVFEDIMPPFWFYFPDRSTNRNQLETACIDSTHLLTRTRRKCCKSGLEGVSNAPWRKVARNGKTSLSLAMVDGLIEPMSVSVAVSHFTEEVEEEMRENGDFTAADLCRDIRNWWTAEDSPGISAITRVQMRSGLRNRLLSLTQFCHFPPPTMYVKGWPSQLWEALIANIDSKLHLYKLCHENTYNVRAFSSMMGETFFSELTLYDRRGRGTVTTCEFGQFLNSAIEKLSMRLDPHRSFHYRTSRKTVYNLVGEAHKCDGDSSDEEKVYHESDHPQQSIIVTDHHFDKPDRLKVKGRKKFATVSSDRNAVKRGSLGVRWEGARRNESKLLPTLRMGIDINEVNV